MASVLDYLPLPLSMIIEIRCIISSFSRVEAFNFYMRDYQQFNIYRLRLVAFLLHYYASHYRVSIN